MSKKHISISTKTGDSGETGLANGERLPKTHPVFEAIGSVDELNSHLGLLAVLFETEFANYRKTILKIQDRLFYLGAELAKSPKVKLQKRHLTELEKKAKELEELMKDDWHSQFLLPGGTHLGAELDIARSVCRRVERSVVELNQVVTIRPLLLQYLNRLSDYLYLLRTYVNAQLKYGEQKFIVER